MKKLVLILLILSLGSGIALADEWDVSVFQTTPGEKLRVTNIELNPDRGNVYAEEIIVAFIFFNELGLDGYCEDDVTVWMAPLETVEVVPPCYGSVVVFHTGDFIIVPVPDYTVQFWNKVE